MACGPSRSPDVGTVPGLQAAACRRSTSNITTAAIIISTPPGRAAACRRSTYNITTAAIIIDGTTTGTRNGTMVPVPASWYDPHVRIVPTNVCWYGRRRHGRYQHAKKKNY